MTVLRPAITIQLRLAVMTDNEKVCSFAEFERLILEKFGKDRHSIYVDNLEKSGLLSRQAAAEFIHEFLRKEIGEEDEEDISPAMELKDIYDCHVCVMHLSQVYVKGIMDAVYKNGAKVIAMKEPVSRKEALKLIERMADRSLRQERKPAGVLKEARYFTGSLNEDNPKIIVDLRSGTSGVEEISGAVRMELTEYVKNPYVIGEDKDVTVVFVCEEGYKAKMAASLCGKSGYRNVYYKGLG